MTNAERDQIWPELAFADWRETAATLHMWTQIVGKIRLSLTPWINHSWHVTLYLTSRGLTTSPIPHGTSTFEMSFDFISHELRIAHSDGGLRVISLRPITVREFYSEVMDALGAMGLATTINTTPNEIADGIPFEKDETHRAYDNEYANRFWRVLLQADRVFKIFRSDFCGKCSPAHFFWGSFDLAVTRFSGRRAPIHPGGVPHLPDAVAREAYSHEVSSLGFWPGSEAMATPLFYSYAYPEPKGFRDALMPVAGAAYNEQLHEFTLPYDVVRKADDPDATLLEFARETYDAAAQLGDWNRKELTEVKPQLRSTTARR